jgi:hypothetical protein
MNRQFSDKKFHQPRLAPLFVFVLNLTLAIDFSYFLTSLAISSMILVFFNLLFTLLVLGEESWTQSFR